MSKDPVNTIATSPMGRFQIMAIALLIFLNGLDGFDVLVSSFAAPDIAEEWGIDRRCWCSECASSGLRTTDPRGQRITAQNIPA